MKPKDVVEWRESIVKLPDHQFFDLIQLYLGKIKTPFNKQRLAEQLSAFLRKPAIQEKIAESLDSYDILILKAVNEIPNPTQAMLSVFFSKKISYSELSEKLLNAEERLKDLQSQNEMQGFMFKMKNDPRITKIGKILRKTSIDELPQFFNVLEGSMSLIGTRPPTVDEYNQYSAHHKRRISIKPGITGLWQVFRLDCFYIDHWSIAADIKILLKTFGAVFTGKGSE